MEFPNNVTLNPAAGLSWSQLNEALYLHQLFAALQAQHPRVFQQYQWCVFPQTHPALLPTWM